MLPTDFEQGLNTVARLVKQFNRNAATYRNPEYNETWAREETPPSKRPEDAKR